MIETSPNAYVPDHVSPPGGTLAETLAALGMAPTELAARLDCPPARIEAVISGEASITAEMALGLARVLGVPAHFWLRREQHYQASLAR